MNKESYASNLKQVPRAKTPKKGRDEMEKPKASHIESIINGLQDGTAAGPSGIGTKHLKYLLSLPKFIDVFTKLICKIMDDPSIVKEMPRLFDF